MKILRLFFAQVLFFILVFTVTHSLRDYILAKRIILIILFAALSFYLFIYIYHSNNVLQTYLINLFGLFLSYEVMKLCEHYLGLLPRYDEMTVISSLGSLFCVAFYLGSITLICFFVKRRNNK
jgi:hypothetical protein